MTEVKIEHSELKRCDLLTLHGRIDSSKAPEVEAAFKDVMNAGRFRLVVDLSDVDYISSAFLRVLISTLKTTHRWNRGDVYLAAMPSRIREVFDLAGLLPLFKTFDTVTEAVGSW